MNCRKHENISLLVTGLIAICLFAAVGCRKKTEPASPAAAPAAAVEETKKTAASNPDDEKAVRQLANEFIAVICSYDAVPITKLEEIFADDFCQMTMDGKVIQGKRDNLFFYRSKREKNKTQLRSQTGRYDIWSVKMSRDLAVVLGKVEAQKWFKDAPEPKKGNFWETLIFQKINGKWYLVEEQSIVPKPAKPADSEKPAAGEQEPNNSPFIGFGVGVKGASDDTNKTVVSDSNGEKQDEDAVPEAKQP